MGRHDKSSENCVIPDAERSEAIWNAEQDADYEFRAHVVGNCRRRAPE